MFKRRTPKTILSKISETFWPSMGWKRLVRYAMHRTARLSGDNYAVAAGLASGAAISSTPILGTHLVQALVLAFITRGNYMASMIGTVWGNPWTFPFLFFFSYQVGTYTLNLFGYNHHPEAEIGMFTLSFLEANIFPLAVGGYICAIVLWPAYFLGFYILIRNAKAARRKYKRHKIKKLAKEITLPNVRNNEQKD